MAGYPYRKQQAFNPNFQRKNNNANTPWNLVAKFGKYEEGKGLVIKLIGFNDNDFNVVNSIDTSVFSVRKITTKSGAEVRAIIVKDDKIDDFSNLIPQLTQQLAATGHYTKESMTTFPNKVQEILDVTATPGEIEQSNKNIIRNWKDLIKRANDPQFRQQFLLVQQFPGNFGFSGKTAEAMRHARLSPSNVTEILSQDQTATFVTDEPTWKLHFNRIVFDKSHPIIYTKGVGDDRARKAFWNLPQIVAAKSELQKKGIPINADSIRNAMGPDAYWGLWKKCSIENSKYPEFYKKKGYDVRFTRPMDPNNDPFMTVARLVNNLTGELNQVAIDTISNELAASGITAPSKDSFNKPVSVNQDQKLLLKFKNFILDKCKAKKINVYDNGSTEDVISNAIYAYAYYETEGMNQLTDAEKQCFAATLTTFVCDRFGITNTSRVQQSFAIMNSFSEEKLEKFAEDIYMAFKKLTDFDVTVREAVEVSQNPLQNATLNDLKSFIKSHTKNKTSIKRDFDDMMGRMENPYNE